MVQGRRRRVGENVGHGHRQERSLGSVKPSMHTSPGASHIATSRLPLPLAIPIVSPHNSSSDFTLSSFFLALSFASSWGPNRNTPSSPPGFLSSNPQKDLSMGYSSALPGRRLGQGPKARKGGRGGFGGFDGGGGKGGGGEACCCRNPHGGFSGLAGGMPRCLKTGSPSISRMRGNGLAGRRIASSSALLSSSRSAFSRSFISSSSSESLADGSFSLRRRRLSFRSSNGEPIRTVLPSSGG
ncbi:hypothetical protein BCR39DRAFT_155452 [Naematelia encephala]|uniref:Uncharacterized protein n=1 Tax=Naematelia encephala TaxID=71784 RepID=A0A1Y2B810_9TREE|nr:hypothetical protein BCR39DRAFT_155452 [Naematelia encephala]